MSKVQVRSRAQSLIVNEEAQASWICQLPRGFEGLTVSGLSGWLSFFLSMGKQLAGDLSLSPFPVLISLSWLDLLGL